MNIDDAVEIHGTPDDDAEPLGDNDDSVALEFLRLYMALDGQQRLLLRAAVRAVQRGAWTDEDLAAPDWLDRLMAFADDDAVTGDQVGLVDFGKSC